jgi:dihydroorotase
MKLAHFLLLAFLAAPAWAQYDLVLKGGHVIDPRNNIDRLADVAITDGKIAAVEANIDASRARQTIDASGLYVTPGLIDLHVHVFATTGIPGAWAGDNSVLPDSFSFRTGGETAPLVSIVPGQMKGMKLTSVYDGMLRLLWAEIPGHRSRFARPSN